MMFLNHIKVQIETYNMYPLGFSLIILSRLLLIILLSYSHKDFLYLRKLNMLHDHLLCIY